MLRIKKELSKKSQAEEASASTMIANDGSSDDGSSCHVDPTTLAERRMIGRQDLPPIRRISSSTCIAASASASAATSSIRQHQPHSPSDCSLSSLESAGEGEGEGEGINNLASTNVARTGVDSSPQIITIAAAAAAPVRSIKIRSSNNNSSRQKRTSAQLPLSPVVIVSSDSSAASSTTAACADSTSSTSSVAVEDSAVPCHLEQRQLPKNIRLRLLSSSNDGHHLNQLHCFVRSQIEVFAATPRDVAAPSPGRKIPIQIGQVGLRCIHCRPDAISVERQHQQQQQKQQKQQQKQPKRVKRAVCYPSTVARVYNSVSDMKFDHFTACPYMPSHVRDEFDRLRHETNRGGAGACASSNGSSSSSSIVPPTPSSTGRYYHQSAIDSGLVDMDGGKGIRLADDADAVSSATTLCTAVAGISSPIDATEMAPTSRPPDDKATSFNSWGVTGSVGTIRKETPAEASLPPSKRQRLLCPAPALPIKTPQPPAVPLPSLKNIKQKEKQKRHQSGPTWTTCRSSAINAAASAPMSTTSLNTSNRILLAAPEDEQILNPIHCFVRRNVEVFGATQADIAAPSPGRKNRVVLGQVGIRCIHCAHLSPRDRVKRAACYPPNVSGIYHSVSNMKFDHFGACRGLSPEARAEFQSLRATCGRKGGRSNRANDGPPSKIGMTSSSTAQYYHDSALNLGLVDTDEGIRFQPDQAARLQAAASMVIHAHQGPPPLPPLRDNKVVSVHHIPPTGMVVPPLTVAALPPLPEPQPSIPFPNGDVIGDGMSALMIAASARAAAEYAAQLPPKMAV
mmetsp:Transcript_10357/g.20809  ORF Transcript_10357/g.20809 Transcript_10357/m.20809 type:complete len:795 (+) Transcript_10357:208-2592(+)|eukprot:CAMPEP_0178665708 /NCGR_PEP_ID=MMETSP0698-20121128/30098_1 /TAXON_ID=265572 /ORGANISM="Extubocellulus spinifer, Strain CCMP396" /LENGTH=794 /DNA_ID=CAMNT_0020309041 /DNA_START=128 /DNA_END=2512 /DNA_ORIENTATION=+